MSEVALRHRVPNPPPVFVGRGAEVERLRTMIERGPVSVVWGLGGLGKSALVSEVLRRSFPQELGRAVLVAMRPGDSVDQLRGEALAALARANGLDDEALEETARDPEAVVATLIDLAERQKIFVVLEDLHHGDFDAAKALLGAIARYARDSRWIVATRHDPGLDGIAEQVMALSAMSDADLGRLAASVSDPRVPGAERTIEAVVAGARGSPWRLRQLVAGARLDDGEDLFVHVSSEARRLLDHMVHLDLPLSPEVLGRIVPLPSVEELTLLERRGMIERSARGFRLHDVARAMLAARPEQGVQRSEMARALATAKDPIATVEALRLMLAAGDLDAAVGLASANHVDLVHAGFGPRLWDLLEASADARFTGIRRQIAVALRTDQAVEWAAKQGQPQGLEERLAWVRALSLRADSASAAAAADSLSADASGGGPEPQTLRERIRFEAMLLAARARYAGGRPQEAVVILRAHPTDDSTRQARRDAMLARCLSALGSYAEALAIVDALAGFVRTDLATPGGPPETSWARREVQQHRAAVLFSAGRLRATNEVLARGGSELSTSPRSILRRMHLAIEGGDLPGGRSAHASLLRFSRLLPVERMHMLTMGCRLGLALGELDELDRSVDELLAIAPEGGNARLYYWTRVIRLAIATVRAQDVPPIAWPEQIPKPTGATAGWLGTFERLHALRRGGAADAKPPVAIPDIVNLKVLALFTDAEAALHRGEHDVAVRSVVESIDLAREHGWALHEADGLRLRAEIAAVTGQYDEVARRARELTQLASRMTSPRYAKEAALVSVIAQALPDVAALTEIAGAGACAPEAARRAQRILGLDVPVDALDELVIAAARRRWNDVTIEIAGDRTSGPRWGIDLIARAVHVEGAEPISLRRHAVMMRVLEVCAASATPVSKAQLAREVWDVTHYHPHRDDARIEMAVSRLRKLVDGDGASTRIVTTGEGYALAGPLWILRPSG